MKDEALWTRVGSVELTPTGIPKISSSSCSIAPVRNLVNHKSISSQREAELVFDVELVFSENLAHRS